VRSAGLAQCSLLLCAALITSAGCSNRTKATNPSNPNNPGSPTAPSSASSAVGYVYVNSKTTTSTPDIQTFAYAADATGQLTPLPGSPFTLGISTSAIGTAANRCGQFKYGNKDQHLHHRIERRAHPGATIRRRTNRHTVRFRRRLARTHSLATRRELQHESRWFRSKRANVIWSSDLFGWI
jgi:hypothetical protein